MKESKQENRVSITLGRKLPIEQYGSLDVRVTYEGDSIKEVEGLAVKEFERLVSLCEAGKINIGGKK